MFLFLSVIVYFKEENPLQVCSSKIQISHQSDLGFPCAQFIFIGRRKNNLTDRPKFQISLANRQSDQIFRFVCCQMIDFPGFFFFVQMYIISFLYSLFRRKIFESFFFVFKFNQYFQLLLIHFFSNKRIMCDKNLTFHNVINSSKRCLHFYR